jgi:hypothetical protein
MHTGKSNLKVGGPGNPNWRKGVSGNPKGKPKGATSIPQMLREIGNRPVDDVLLAKLHAKYGPAHNPKTLHEAMLMAAAKDAAQGDMAARTFIAERTEGKVSDHLTMEDVTPTKIIFEEVLVGGKVVENSIKRIITRPTNDSTN